MKELQDLARTLLEEGTIKVVIGYEEGRRGVRPAFVTRPEDVDALIFDPRCVHNLATYLSKRRTHVAALGRPAVVVKGCDARAVAGLIRESQLNRDEVVIIGVRCGGVLGSPVDGTLSDSGRDASSGDHRPAVSLAAETLAPRCVGCETRVPKLADYLVGPEVPFPQIEPPGSSPLEKLETMSPAERWAFWQKELERCVRCHACRQVCPMCFCERCVADKTEPQWIESSPHPRGNFSFHVTRALHQAGRCVGCGECQRVCPAGVPLGLINRKMAQVVASRFGYHATDDPSVGSPIGTFRQDDTQEFIL